MAKSEILEPEEAISIFTAAPGFEAQLLDPGQLHSLEHRLGPSVISGVYAEVNAGLDSYQYTLALTAGAEKLGAPVRPGAVRGLESSLLSLAWPVLRATRSGCGMIRACASPPF